MSSGEDSVYALNKRFKTEYEIMMAQKQSQRKAPRAPKNPEKLYIKRRGRV